MEPWIFVVPVLCVAFGWWIRARRGSPRPNWTGQYLKPRELPPSIRAAFKADRRFRCGFDVRRPKGWVVSGPAGRCVVADDALACQFARMTYAVVQRGNAMIVVRRGTVLTQRVDVSDGRTEVWITPYDWAAAKRLLIEAGWPVTEEAA
jgi:hypothetical protein